MAAKGKQFIPGAPKGFAAARLCKWGPGLFEIEMRAGGQLFFPVGACHKTEDAAWAALKDDDTERQLRADAATLWQAFKRGLAPNPSQRARPAAVAGGQDEGDDVQPAGAIGVGDGLALQQQQQQANQGVLPAVAGLGKDAGEEEEQISKDRGPDGCNDNNTGDSDGEKSVGDDVSSEDTKEVDSDSEDGTGSGDSTDEADVEYESDS